MCWIEWNNSLSLSLSLSLVQQLARQGEVEKQERLRFHKLLYQKRLAEKAKQNYAKNYQLCYQILLQVVDFSTKMAHYRKLTQGWAMMS